MQSYLNNARVFAFLDLITSAESWLANKKGEVGVREVGYNEGVGFTKLANLYQHPGRVAGRYQFKTDTWNRAKRDCGLYDFTQESQDIAGVYLLSTLPVTHDSPYPPNDKMLPFVLKGTRISIEYAIELGSGTWASFPTKYINNKDTHTWEEKPNFDRYGINESHYSPQHSAPLEDLLKHYDECFDIRNRGLR